MSRPVKYGYHGLDKDLADLMGGLDGWREIVESLYDDLVAMGWSRDLFQIKEKFGGLRFYIGEGSSEIFDRIAKAENTSLATCMVCGNLGRRTGKGWILTLCEDHEQGR